MRTRRLLGTPAVSQAINWVEFTGWLSLEWAARATPRSNRKTDRPLRFTRLSGNDLACWVALIVAWFAVLNRQIHISPATEPEVRSRK